MTHQKLQFCRSALYLPASNARAIEKARTLPADMVLLDLEDAVPAASKDEARTAAVGAAFAGFGDRICAIRINGPDSEFFEADCNAVTGSAADYIVVPKVEDMRTAQAVYARVQKSLLPMIETPFGLYAAKDIAALDCVAGLIAGTNDLIADMRLRPGAGRSGLELALQTIVLAAKASGKAVFDGVFNALDHMDGLTEECQQGYAYGFNGKTLIHPAQIETANQCFMADEAALEDARALIAAAGEGAERFRGRMIEAMHVEAAKIVIAQAEAAKS